MAKDKNYKKQDSQETGASKPAMNKSSQGRSREKDPEQSRRRRASRNSNRGSKPNASAERNAVTEKATIETPTSQASLVFPSASAAMASFGNYTTTPGQRNFILDANNIHYSTGMTDERMIIDAASWDAQRTLNAMVIHFTPLFGCVNSDNFGLWENPVMLSCMNIKQYCDTSFGTNTSYTAQQLGVYLMAVAAVFPQIAKIKRILRLAVTYLANQFPQFVPRGLFAALQISDDEGHCAAGEGAMYTAKHLRSSIDALNQLIISFNRLPMPPEFGLFGYNDDLYDHIYMDSPDITTAQLYLFKEFGYWLYDTEASPHGAQLFCIEGGGPRSVDAEIKILGEMIERISVLRTDDSAMLQNLFNAYGSKDMITVPTVDYATLQPLDFVYDERILTAIENMVICGPDDVSISAVQADAAANNINFHMWLNDVGHAAPAIEIPLQFHKAYDQITREDVGYALRFHPSFRDQKHFYAWEPVHPEATEYSHLTADGYTPFAIVRGASILGLSDSSEIWSQTVTTRRWLHSDTTEWWLNSLDFKTRPIFVQYTRTHDETEPAYHFRIDRYTAERDVECTYRLEDMHMFWIYLTTDIYGSNINRNVTGTRTRS